MALRARLVAVLSIAAVGGAGTMSVELAAVRLLAPWFGTSLSVWTNVIAVVLLALSVGYLLGARLASGARPLRSLGIALLVAAGSTTWIPALAAPVAGAFLPAEVALSEASNLVLWGSLASALILFLPAAVCLGTVAPLAVETLHRGGGERAGHAGGLVLATSTLGSLVGVFGTTHVLLPSFGLTASLVTAGVALAVAGLAALALERAGYAVALVLLPLSALPLSRLAPPEPPDGVTLLATVESEYQSVRVVEDARREPTMRFLQVNESFDSFQSAWSPEPGLLPAGYYYNAFALPPAWQGATGEWRTLVLGLGAGTTVRVLRGAAPPGLEHAFVGVELDPTVVDLARAHLDLEQHPADTIIAGLDARVALRAIEGSFDEIVLDVYANQVEIPAHLATLELFGELRARLVDGGWLVVNVSGFGHEDPVLRALAGTCASAFDASVLSLHVPFSRNHILFARRDADVPSPDADGFLALPPGAVGEQLAACTLPGRAHMFEPGVAEPLTDDRAPLALLQRRSLALARSRVP